MTMMFRFGLSVVCAESAPPSCPRCRFTVHLPPSNILPSLLSQARCRQLLRWIYIYMMLLYCGPIKPSG
jgi:hypothetical protein